VVVDAAGHVSEISINCGHASINIFHLWADNGFQDFSLLTTSSLRPVLLNKEKS
jgi:hypothetical protein